MSRLCRLVAAAALGGALSLAFVGACAGQGDKDDPLRRAERSVVRVVTVSLDANGQPEAMETGSGFAVAPGLVVTNRHVVQGAAQAVAVETFVIPEQDAGGASERATLRQTWSDADLALLSAPGLTSPPLAIAETFPGKEATVRALGYPGVTDELRNLPLADILRPQEPYVTPGSIALFSSIAPGGSRIATIFHTAPINPGNSGGPLIDACGRVIGVNTWGAGAELAADGQLTTPQGQFVATQSSVLVRFLSDAQVKATLVSTPCVPAAAQLLQERLKTDETAISDQKEQLVRLDAELQESLSRERQLSLMLSLVAVGLGGLTVALVAIRYLPRWRAHEHEREAEAHTPPPLRPPPPRPPESLPDPTT